MALNKVLERDGVNDECKSRIKACGINTYRQLIHRPSSDLAHSLDISLDETEAMIQNVSLRVAPKGKTAFSMFLDCVNRPTCLRTHLPDLDAAFHGGLANGSLIEFVGISGIGKTQWAMTLAILCSLEYPESSVIYFDVEQTLNVKRFYQIAASRLDSQYKSSSRPSTQHVKSVFERIRIIPSTSLKQFQSMITLLTENMVNWHVKLVIVDSIAALFRKGDVESEKERQHHMANITRDLKHIGELHEAFIIVTNRASIATNADGQYTKVELGDVWSHYVTTRLLLSRSSISNRAVTVLQSPVAGHVTQYYRIAEQGIIPPESSIHVATSQDFAMNDELLCDMALSSLPLTNPMGTIQSLTQSSHNSQSLTVLEVSDEASQHSTPIDIDFVCDSNDEDDISHAFLRE